MRKTGFLGIIPSAGLLAGLVISGSAGAIPFSLSYSAQWSSIPLENALSVATGHARMNAYYSGDGWGQQALSCPLTAYTWYEDPVWGLTVIATVTCTRNI
jgi:hypothetical protein